MNITITNNRFYARRFTEPDGSHAWWAVEDRNDTFEKIAQFHEAWGPINAEAEAKSLAARLNIIFSSKFGYHR